METLNWYSISKIAQESKNVAEIIIEQLGGNNFISTTGAKNLLRLNNGISFKLPGKSFTQNRINYVKITLNPKDTYNTYNTYDVEFGRTRGTQYKIINTLNDIYANQLQEVFTQETGLDTTFIIGENETKITLGNQYDNL